MATKEELIKTLFTNWSGEEILDFEVLPLSGSDRVYYRIKSNRETVLGAYNPDRKENIAFLGFTRHFLKKGLAVPEIYVQDLDKNIYLLEDLGDNTLFEHLTKTRSGKEFPQKLIDTYKKVIDELPPFQVRASEDLDYSICYPRAKFDKQSMMWDMNYFKYYFLKLAKVPFDEQYLEDDFETFTNYLLSTDHNYFLYRDFQSRNIMIVDDVPYFIDYQGGRKGALQYDIASLLYDAKADIPQDVREELLEYYMDILENFITIDRKQFREYYYGYVLIRIMQAMGAYGFRGFYEKKEHFLKSIPFAINNLEWILKNIKLPVELPSLMEALNTLTQSEELRKFGNKKVEHNTLKVTINSFSFKKGIPSEPDNGGGYVFDCRAIHNPGKYDQYKQLTGRDKPVIDFLDKEPEMADFLENVYSLVGQSVEKYQSRNFTNLMISFGCTGGQHRSVYGAEHLAKYLQSNYNISIELSHREQNIHETF